MRVTLTVVLACVLVGAHGWIAQLGEVQQKEQTQVEEVQQTGHKQVEEVQQTGHTQVVTSEEEGDDDDLSKDPDWVPTDEDYAIYESDKLEDYYGGSAEYFDEDGYEYDLEDENELWLSDEDPDWVPEEDVSEEQEEEQEEEASEYETLLLQIAQAIIANAKLNPELAQDSQVDLSLDNILDHLRSVELSESDARQVLNNLILSAKVSQDATQTQQESHKSREDETQGYQTLQGHQEPKVAKRHVEDQYAVQQQDQYRPYQQQGQGPVDSWQLSQGVEQLVPSGGGDQRQDLGYGVEPEHSGSSHGEDEDDKPSLLDIFRYGWGLAKDVAGTVGDKVHGAASGVIDKVQDAAQTVKKNGCLLVVCTQSWWIGLVADLVHESLSQGLHLPYVQDPSASKRAAYVETMIRRSLSKTGEGIATLFQSVHRDLRRFKEAVVSTFARFGTVVQEGLGYCIDRLLRYDIKAQGMQVLEKLEKKLSEGNENVRDFFDKVGRKVSEWKEQHLAEHVDEGLVEGQQHQNPAGYQTEGQNPNIEQVMPDLFTDDEILIQLHKLVEVGDLTQEDIRVITQQQEQQQDQHEGYQQEQQQSQQQGYQQEQQQGDQQAQQQQQQSQQQGYQQEQQQGDQQAQQQQQQNQQQRQGQEQHHGYY